MSLTGPTVIASGGDTVQDIGGYRIHTFKTVGTSSFVVNRGGSVEVLVVAGGGGGGGNSAQSHAGGGGGAGELIYNSSFVISGTVSVTVGAGGAGEVNVPSYIASVAGSNSAFGALVAQGGGLGSHQYQNGGAGGSGGGAARGNPGAPPTGGASTKTIGFGNAGGGSGSDLATNTASAGSGGGAGGPGLNSYDNNIKTPGAPGLTYAISGTSKTYAAGGAGGSRNSGDNGVSAAANSGSGGSGGSGSSGINTSGGSGGSGVVVIKYQFGLAFSGQVASSPWGIFTVTPNGLTSDQAATNALALLQFYPRYDDGVYWINCGGVPTQTYCLMNPKWDGGGWMLIMKAAQGSTFNWGSTHWTTTSTLNPTDTTTTVADAKFDVFNSVPVTDVMAVWPTSDIGAGNTGGSLAVSDGWVWLVKNWYTSAITPLAGFQIDRPATPPDIFNFSGFSTSSPIWSYQTGLRAHVFGSGSHVPSAPGSDVYFTRWGFMWNNESGTTHTQDAFAGIGLNIPSSSGGDFWFWTGVNKKGFNRNIAWLMYGR